MSEFLETRNCRSVWSIGPEGFKGAHFATFPTELARRCIVGGCPAGGIAGDIFSGSGTVALTALKLGRQFVGVELNPEYIALSERRMQEKFGLFIAEGSR